MRDADNKEMKSALSDLRKQFNDLNKTVQCSIQAMNTKSCYAEKRIEKRFERLERIQYDKQELTRRLETFQENKRQVKLKTSSRTQQKPKMLKAVQRAFLDCMRTSTGHGLPQMAKTDNIFLSLLWVVFFLVGVGGGIFMIHQTVGEFLQYGVITTTKIIRENEITMPAITFCSDANVRDMIMFCLFEMDSDKCKMTDLTLYNELGGQFNCVQINYGTNVTELVKSTGDGDVWRHGYAILVYIPPKSSLRFAITDNSANVVYGNMHNNIRPGQETEIALSKTVQIALAQPHSDCNKDNNYRQVNCRVECFNKKMTEICGCVYPKECGIYDNWTQGCKEALTEKTGSIRSQCSLNCPAECNQVNFEAGRMDVAWESVGYEDNMSEASKKFNISGMSDDEFKKRFTLILIYFSKLETTKITQSPSMTLTSLIANVGGLLGLFLGFSLLSSIELLDLVIRIVIIVWRTTRSSSQINAA